MRYNELESDVDKLFRKMIDVKAAGQLVEMNGKNIMVNGRSYGLKSQIARVTGIDNTETALRQLVLDASATFNEMLKEEQVAFIGIYDIRLLQGYDEANRQNYGLVVRYALVPQRPSGLR